MSTINSISSTTTTYNPQNISTATSTKASEGAKSSSDQAAVYESGTTTTNKTYKADKATINRLLQDAENKKQQLKDLVERTLGKQADVFTFATFNKFQTGEATVSAEEIEQAKEDISEDGYWGVEQTSERLYSFAYALAGGDSKKADDMMAAIEKGYEQATKAWGKELPEISQKTLEATREKIEAWKTGNNTISATS